MDKAIRPLSFWSDGQLPQWDSVHRFTSCIEKKLKLSEHSKEPKLVRIILESSYD